MRFFKVLVACATAAMVSGCAEWRNRGGTMDLIQDKVFFQADTKHMRLLRSYVMVAGLTRVAAKSPMSLDERLELASKVRSATMTIDRAYNCAGVLTHSNANQTIYWSNTPKRQRSNAGCAFFDEQMANLDSALLRIARMVFMPEENRDLFEAIRRGLGTEAPALSSLIDIVDSGTAILDKGSKLVTGAGQLVNAPAALLRLVANSFRSGSRLAPIYRDALELEMQVALDYVQVNNVCPADPRRQPSVSTELSQAKREAICALHQALGAAYQNGAGDLSTWAEPLEAFFKDPYIRQDIRPLPGHFQDVTELLINVCQQLVGLDNVKACFPKRGNFPADFLTTEYKKSLEP